MKILQVAHSLPFLNQAGTEVYTFDLSKKLSKRHQVSIFTRGCDENKQEYLMERLTVDGIGVHIINNTFRHCDSFRKYYDNPDIDDRFESLLREVRPDVVHIQHAVFLSVGILEKAILNKIPVVYTLHDYWPLCPKWHILKKDMTVCSRCFTGNFGDECSDCAGDMLNIGKASKSAYLAARKILPQPLVRRLREAYLLLKKGAASRALGVEGLRSRYRRITSLLNNADLLIAPTRYIRDRFAEAGIPPWKIKLLDNGIDSRLFSGIEKEQSEKIRIAFIGTFMPAKGIDRLIDSFNSINSENAELRIYGRLQAYSGFEYYPAHLKRIARKKNITFMGEFDHSDIGAVFSRTDILVVPSLWPENSPLVIKESLSSGTPVIASNIGGIPELVSDGVNGLLFDPWDKEDLKRKLQYIVDNPAAIRKLAENRPQVKEAEDNALDLEHVYGDLAANNELSGGLKSGDHRHV